MIFKKNKINFGNVSPSFMIIGTQKGGTTALHEYLIQHSQLIAPKEKELHFFDTFDAVHIQDYENKFPKKYFTNKISFESTPRYLYYPGVAKKIYDYNPNMKFIVVLRDPVKRAYSAWNMYKQMGENKKMIDFFKKNEERSSKEKLYTLLYNNNNNRFPSFSEWVNYEIQNESYGNWIEPSIVRRGYYKEQIDAYLEFFSSNSFMFIDSLSLKKDTINVLNSIATFLKISNFNGLELDLGLKHKREYSEPLNDELYKELLLHFQIKNKGLEELVSLKLDWMNSKIFKNV